VIKKLPHFDSWVFWKFQIVKGIRVAVGQGVHWQDYGLTGISQRLPCTFEISFYLCFEAHLACDTLEKTCSAISVDQAGVVQNPIEALLAVPCVALLT
jgi:hypothetical protein